VKASLRWLREIVPGLDASPSEIADRLTRAGLEVESFTEFGAASRSVFVVRVEKIEPHPARPKLRLVTIATPKGSQRVVCGAPNVPDPGGLVVLAPNGTYLPAKNMTLEPKDIGGVVSEGMLCSESELGLRISGGEAGILILSPEVAKEGQTLADAIPESSDTIFEIGLTPNRPDGLGHVGLARELAALFSLPFSLDVPAAKNVSKDRVEDRVRVRIDDLERCPLYGAAFVSGVKIGPSPLGVTYRLESLGVRSISNAVDVTNIVMLKYGHPLHGFDFALVRGGEIVVRRATQGEELKTLDGVARKLEADDLVIADGQGPVALAGVMGGEGSELRATTTDVLIECAYFSPRGIRRSSRRHGLHTESSHRFERGVDPLDIDIVLRDAARLLSDWAGGAVLSTAPIFGQAPPPAKPIRLRKARMDALLGLAIPMTEASGILARLGCKLTSESPDALEIVPPSHRPDLGIEEDLIEEVVRVHGMDRVPVAIPPVVPQLHDPRTAIRAAVRRAAVEVGLSEALTFAFVSKKELEAVSAPAPTFVLKNPLSEERSVMRTSLLPGLIDAARRARHHGVSDVRLFTTGSRFLDNPGFRLAREVPSFAAILAGHRESPLTKPARLDIYDAKGIASEIVARATSREVVVEREDSSARTPFLHPRGAASVRVDDTIVGRFGPLHPNVARELDLDFEAFVIELSLDVLETVGARTPRYKPIPALPAVTRDIAVTVHDDVPSDAILRAIRDAAGELCESAEVFDVFRGGAIPADHRSLAYHVIYRDPRAAADPGAARTLNDAEVDERHARVVKTVTERFGAVLRA